MQHRRPSNPLFESLERKNPQQLGRILELLRGVDHVGSLQVCHGFVTPARASLYLRPLRRSTHRPLLPSRTRSTRPLRTARRRLGAMARLPRARLLLPRMNCPSLLLFHSFCFHPFFSFVFDLCSFAFSHVCKIQFCSLATTRNDPRRKKIGDARVVLNGSRRVRPLSLSLSLFLSVISLSLSLARRHCSKDGRAYILGGVHLCPTRRATRPPERFVPLPSSRNAIGQLTVRVVIRANRRHHESSDESGSSSCLFACARVSALTCAYFVQCDMTTPGFILRTLHAGKLKKCRAKLWDLERE